MAELIIDGFDDYGPANQHTPTVATLITQYWNAVGVSGMSIVPSLNDQGGYAIQSGANQWISKTLPGTFGTLVGGLRFTTAGVGSATTYVLKFLDVGTPQCSVIINIDGTFSVVNGDYGGAILGTSSTSVLQNSVHFIEFRCSYSATGSYELWLDGNSILSGTGNTITTSHNYATQFLIGNTTGGGTAIVYDDLYLFDTSGSINNAPLLNNTVVLTTSPTSDSQTQFTNDGNLLGIINSITGDTSATSSNTLYLRAYVAPVACTIQSVSWTPASTNGSVNFKPAIYADTGGAPGALLSGGSAITGCTAGTTITAALTSPVSLSASVTYWIGWLTDDAVSYQQAEGTPVSTLGYVASSSYSGGLPGTAPTMTANQPSYTLYGICTGSSVNYTSLNQNPAPGDVSSVDSSTVNNEDLYGFQAVASVTQIFSVAVKANLRKSASGSRTIDLRVKSGSTDSGGSNTGQAPGTNYQSYQSFFPTDPNTSAAWTVSGLNAATSGIKVAS